MARVGRKRKDRLAKVTAPIGRSVATSAAESGAVEAHLRRCRDMDILVPRQPVETVAELEREIGALYLAKARRWDGSMLHLLLLRAAIDQAQYEAGRGFDALARRYRMILIGGPRPTGGGPSHADEVSAEAAERIKSDYEDADKAIPSIRHRRLLVGVLRDEPVDPAGLPGIREALSVLVVHFSKPKKRADQVA